MLVGLSDGGFGGVLVAQKIFNLLKRKKVKFKYEGVKIPYVLAGHYNPDFIIETSKGTVYIETKGYLRPEHKRKMVAVKKQHPELDISYSTPRRLKILSGLRDTDLSGLWKLSLKIG